MNTARTTQFIAFLTAVVMVAVINGGMLLTFDDVAQQAQAAPVARTAVVLDTVTIVGSRS
ncbi:MAG: hypothetical protein V4858_06025 [Pseudomonadota bacterium]